MSAAFVVSVCLSLCSLLCSAQSAPTNVRSPGPAGAPAKTTGVARPSSRVHPAAARTAGQPAAYQVRTLYQFLKPDEQRHDTAFGSLANAHNYKLSNVHLTALRAHGYAAALTTLFKRRLLSDFVFDSLVMLEGQPYPVMAPAESDTAVYSDLPTRWAGVISVILLVTPRQDSLVIMTKETTEEVFRAAAFRMEHRFVLRAGRVYPLDCPDGQGLLLGRRIGAACGSLLVAHTRKQLRVPCTPKDLVWQDLQFTHEGLWVYYCVRRPGQSSPCVPDGADPQEYAADLFTYRIPYRALDPAIFRFSFPKTSPCPYPFTPPPGR